jgi:hypothetical protein
MRKYYVAWDSTALVSATAKTIIELPTVANIEADICELYLGCDASSAGNLKIEFGKFTTTGTGTAVSAATVQLMSGGDPGLDTALSAIKIKDTVEPTGFSNTADTNALYPSLLVPLPMYVPFQWPLNEGFTIPESTNFAIRLTASIGCNTAGWIAWKE